jgi:hypothetical protein
VLITIYALTDPDSGEGYDVGQTTKHPSTRDHDEASLYDDAYIPCRAAPAPPLHDGGTHRHGRPIVIVRDACTRHAREFAKRHGLQDVCAFKMSRTS